MLRKKQLVSFFKIASAMPTMTVYPRKELQGISMVKEVIQRSFA
jgi:hypothetical protein